MENPLGPPELTFYRIHDDAPEIAPGRPQREWMDLTGERYAYRCLPLTMANSSGWELLMPFELRIDWNGNASNESLKLSSPDRKADVARLATAHFRQGILTFHTGYLFRTPPGWATLAGGSPNRIKDGIQPLAGLIETDWLPFPFTMNWKMTRPGRVRFQKGEPFCFVTLVRPHALEAVQPRLLDLHDDPALKAEYEEWKVSRDVFNQRMAGGDKTARIAGWQRHYMKGETAIGTQAVELGSPEHVTKRRLKTPK